MFVRLVCEHTFVRWDNLVEEQEQRATLPGYRDDAVVRHFDAPDSIPTRFYEVRAKSILNRVPEASRMPFRWTINPFRGCTHACHYCAWGETPVLMGDGRHKPLADLDVGDEIYGTVRGLKYRYYARTTVLDKWITIKPAYRVVLEDDTELIVSGDHRLLTNRGWKHVLNSARSEPDRPHLTMRNRLIGTGAFARQPDHNSDYQRGYLCGIMRGDGHLGRYPRRGGGSGLAHNFRLALADLEALHRQDFLAAVGIAAGARVFQRAVGARTERCSQSRLGASPHYANFGPHRVASLCERRLVPEASLAGYLMPRAAERAFALRIANTDSHTLEWITVCARRFGFDVGVDDTNGPNNLQCIRIKGGLSEHLRFFHLTDPAITRKRSIEGQMVKTFANLKVAAVEPLGKAMPLYDITTGTGDFIANGVVSHNCFARPTHKYLDFNAGRDFEREIVVKVNAPERLRVELARPSWKGRAHRARDKYGPVSVGRRALQADGRHLGGDARGVQPVLGADQIAAVAARPGADVRAREKDGFHRGAVGSDAR